MSVGACIGFVFDVGLCFRLSCFEMYYSMTENIASLVYFILFSMEFTFSGFKSVCM